jgi:hypothetical protein
MCWPCRGRFLSNRQVIHFTAIKNHRDENVQITENGQTASFIIATSSIECMTFVVAGVLSMQRSEMYGSQVAVYLDSFSAKYRSRI